MAQQPLRVTRDTMQNVIKLCRIHHPAEACGFIVADSDSDLGVRLEWIPNVSPSPLREFIMDDDAVRAAYAKFDKAGEEPVAMFHSHPKSEPIMSDKDLAAAQDDSLAYLIISLASTTPRARAYRVERWIGNPIAHQIMIDLDGAAQKKSLPPGPWCLQTGNYVRISYQRTGKTVLSTNVAHVTRCEEDIVHLDPDHKTGAKMIPIERIRAVHVLVEGPQAAAVRTTLHKQAANVKALMAGHQVESLPRLLDAMFHSFPVNIQISMDEPR